MKNNNKNTWGLAIPILLYLGMVELAPPSDDVYEWLFSDYLLRSIVITYVLLNTYLRAFVFSEYGTPWPLDSRFPSRREKFIGVVFLIFILERLLVIPLNIINDAYPETVLFRFFEITDQSLLIFDLTVGLLLVAFSEEILYRGLMKSLLEKFWNNGIFIVVISGALFALVHWRLGLGHIFYAGVIGVVMMAVYLSAKSLWPTTVAHYLINLWVFWPD